jgi:Ca2+-binding RTX toxin-like protein
MWGRRSRNLRARRAVAALLSIFLATFVAGMAAANIVAPSKAALRTKSKTMADILPTACNGLGITSVLAGNNVNGTGASELILGTAAFDSLNGNGGNDCILGGGGIIDFIDGGNGIDVCIGGAGFDFFSNCETEIQ